MTNLRSLSDVFRAAKKLAVACALATTVAAAASAQTPTNKLEPTGNAGVNTTSPPNPLTLARSGSSPYTSRPANELLQLVDKTDNTPQILFGSAYNGMILRYTGTDSTALNQRLGVITGGGIEAFVVNNDGNVGIGTTDPSLGGVVASRFTVTQADASTGFSLGNTAGTPRFAINGNSNGTWTMYDYGSAAWTAGITQKSGSVGIGKVNPLYKLDVNGEINATGIHINGTPISAGGSSQWGDGANSTIHYNTGNVGIGTPTPDNPLTVKASGSSTHGFAVKNNALTQYLTYIGPRGSGGTAQNQGFLAVADQGTSTVVLDAAGPSYFNGGNVGIGTAGPGSKLEINLAGTEGTGLNVLSGASNKYALIQWGRTSAEGMLAISRSAGAFFANSVPGDAWFGSTNGTIALGDQTAGTASLIVKSGNVGIGITSPTEKLHVVGNGKVSGNLTVDGTINAKYQDLAEWVPSSEQLSAGTVVVLDTTKSNQVISSGTAYDTRVAGVISAQPGITLGEGGEGKVLVATTGRVRVKVDASRGPIQIGDLLVTSDVSGVAMKSEAVNLGSVQIHRPGTIIGKALEPLAKGKGEILVLLSLQ